MPKFKSHKNCKYFGYKACPNNDNETMKRALQDIAQYNGGDYQISKPFPKDEEIDAICSNCDKYISEKV